MPVNKCQKFFQRLYLIFCIVSLSAFCGCGTDKKDTGDSNVSSKNKQQQSDAKKSGDSSCTVALNLDGAVTYYNGVKGFLDASCTGCHGRIEQNAGLDFSTYDTIMNSLRIKSLPLDILVAQVAKNHNGSYEETTYNDLLLVWQAARFPRGTIDANDESPFFEENSAKNSDVDLNDFDPYAKDLNKDQNVDKSDVGSCL